MRILALAALLALASCGSQSPLDRFIERYSDTTSYAQLGAGDPEFEAAMSLFRESHREDGRVRVVLATMLGSTAMNESAQFQRRRDAWRESTLFLETCDEVFGAEPLRPGELGPSMLLPLVETHPGARTWIRDYATSEEVMSSFVYIVGVGATSPLRRKLIPSAVHELENRSTLVDAHLVGAFVRSGLLTREPRVLEHLRAGIPPSGESLGSPEGREYVDDDPRMSATVLALAERRLDPERKDGPESAHTLTVEEVTAYQKWLGQVRDCVPLAKSGLADAYRLLFERSPASPEAVAEVVAMGEDWVSHLASSPVEGSDASPSPAAAALLARLQPDRPEGTGDVLGWAAPWISDGLSTRTSIHVHGDVPRLLTTTAALLTVEANLPAAELLEELRSDEWTRRFLALMLLTPDHAVEVAKALNEALEMAGKSDSAGASAPTVAELSSARAGLAEAPREPIVDEFLLRLISHPHEETRVQALGTCRERFGRDGFVEALFDFIVHRQSFTASEYEVYRESLLGFEGVETPVVACMERALDQADGPQGVFWVLKVLTLDVLERRGTAAALPVLERLRTDTGAYSWQETVTDAKTDRVERTESKNYVFGTRASEVIATIQAR